MKTRKSFMRFTSPLKELSAAFLSTGSFWGMSLIAVLFPLRAPAQGTPAPGGLPNDTVGLFVASVGGTGTDYTAYGAIDSTSFLFSMVLPGTKQWVVLDKEASESYSPNTMYVFAQDSQVYEVVNWNEFTAVANCDFTKHGPTTGQPNPGNFTLHNGCDLNHLGFVGNSVYFVVPATWDMFHLCYCIGGEFQVSTNGKTTTLLSRTDTDNQATMDVADSGTLYAVSHDVKNATLDVWTRNLTTGHLETLLRSYSINGESLYSGWSFEINDGILYVGVKRVADQAFQIWTTGLTAPLASESPLQLLQTYPASSGSFSTGIRVNNGKVAIPFGSSSIKNGIAVLDVATNSTQYYDMG